MVLLVTVFVIPGIAGAFTQGQCRPEKGFGMKKNHMSPLGIWQHPKIVQKLELTDEQVEGLKKADFAHREKSLESKSKLDALHLELEKLFAAKSVDEAKVLEVAQKISDLKGKLFVQRIESRLAVAKLLTADQVGKLKMFRSYHLKHRGKINKTGKHCGALCKN
jgi:Spy/CpxP family protein refolding chaperone